MRISRFITFILLTVLALVLTIAGARSVEPPPKPAAATEPNPPALFTPVPSTGRGGSFNPDPTVVRQRTVTANISLLTRTRGGTVTLNLFEDVTYPVVIEQTEEQPAPPPLSSSRGGSFFKPGNSSDPVLVQFGRVQGKPKSEVYLVSSGDRLSANVRLPDGKLYEVTPTATKTHLIREINPSAFPADEPPGAFAKMLRSSSRGMPRPNQTAYEVLGKKAPLKVLVLYTPRVSRLVGDEKTLSLLVTQVQAQTNKSYEQSGVNLRVKIARWGEVDYTETGDAEKDLTALTEAADRMNLRQQFKVDAVSLWVARMDSACGFGYVNQTPTDFRQHPYAVVKAECAVSNFSFAHELGHNLGSCHDRETEKNCLGSFPYSFGYQDPEGEFRTIMSYPCKANKECPRWNYWSSPNLVVNDKKPMGVAEQVDNARSLNHIT
jgi:hypothetical protein